MNLLKVIEEYILSVGIGEAFSKVLQQLVEGEVSLWFWVVFVSGSTLIIKALLMIRKIKKIKKIFNGTDSEWKKLDKKIKTGVYDNVLGYFILGIIITLFSLVFFPKFGIFAIKLAFLILMPLILIVTLGIAIVSLVVYGIEGIKKTDLEIVHLQKKALKEENKIEQKTELSLKKEDEND